MINVSKSFSVKQWVVVQCSAVQYSELWDTSLTVSDKTELGKQYKNECGREQGIFWGNLDLT